MLAVAESVPDAEAEATISEAWGKLALATTPLDADAVALGAVSVAKGNPVERLALTLAVAMAGCNVATVKAADGFALALTVVAAASKLIWGSAAFAAAPPAPAPSK